MYTEMRLKPNDEIVRVYDITDGMATIFSEVLYQHHNNGWSKVKVSKLVPKEYPLNAEKYLVNTKRKKAKQRLQMKHAIWETSDGLTFTHNDIELAIQHQLILMENEEKENKENV